MKYPQDDITLERVFQVLGDILRTKNLQYHGFDDMEPWIKLLFIVASVVFITHHITLQTFPM